MSTEPLPTAPVVQPPAEPVAPLPTEPKLSSQIITFTRPPIIVGQSADGLELNLRQGESVQVKLEIEESWGYEAVDEKPFKIMATSRRVFAGLPINVLDELSEPTAAVYLSQVGTRVLHGFRCVEARHLSKLHGKPVWATWRGFIMLP